MKDQSSGGGADQISAIIAMIGSQLGDEGTPFFLLVDLPLRPGAERELEPAVGAARGKTLREDGALAFELFRDMSRPDHFILYEGWRSLRDLERHLRTAHAAALQKEFSRLGSGPPNLRVCKVVAP